MKNREKSRVVKPVRFTAARNDASVERIQRSIEKDYHLPKGSVNLFLPLGKVAEPTSKMAELREQWEKFNNPLPFTDCLVEAKLCVYQLVEDWDVNSFDRIDLAASVPVFMRLVESELISQCPGSALKWKVSWAKRYQKEGLCISTPSTESHDNFTLSDTLAEAFYSVYEDVRLEWDWEVMKPKVRASKSNS